MNDSRDFKDAESVRSGLSHVPSQPVLLPLYRDPGGLLSRNNQSPDIWNSQVYRETFLQIQRRLLQHLVPEDSILGFLTLRKRRDRQPEIHSTLRREDSQKKWSRPTKTADLGTSL